MRVLVCGGRNFTDHYKFDEAMKLLPFKPSIIIHGDAKGADTLGRMWGMSKGIFTVAVPALWDAHGKGAGPKRNQAMIYIMKPEYCVALPGGHGTDDMIRRCKSSNIPVWQPYGSGTV